MKAILCMLMLARMSRADGTFLTELLLAVGVIVFVILVIHLARLPGKVARERHHPSADAINLCGWLSLLLWPLWFVGIIWAHSIPAPPKRAYRPAGPLRSFDPVPPDLDAEVERSLREMTDGGQ
jgi:hypothetical protein